MKIAIPVECQNGHKATWHVHIEGLEVRELGVPHEEKCDCPKHNFGQGYHASGDPYVPTHNGGETNG